jgi:hypothetical protein
MSTEAMAVVGGVLASIPGSLLIAWVALRARAGREWEVRPAAQQYPPVVVIQGGQPVAPSLPIVALPAGVMPEE